MGQLTSVLEANQSFAESFDKGISKSRPLATSPC
jgi:hypothetical protein